MKKLIVSAILLMIAQLLAASPAFANEYFASGHAKSLPHGMILGEASSFYPQSGFSGIGPDSYYSFGSNNACEIALYDATQSALDLCVEKGGRRCHVVRQSAQNVYMSGWSCRAKVYVRAH